MITTNTLTILIIDDSRVSRLFARNYILERHPDWPVLEAGSGEEGLALLESNVVDQVILDVNMPGMGGIAAAAQLRARYPALPICVLTANVQHTTRERVLALGVDFAEKPVTREGITRILAGLESR